MLLYNFLDIITTISETFVLYVLIVCFCKKNRFHPMVCRIVPCVISGISTIFLTYFTALGAIKIFLILPVIIILIQLFYKIPFHESLIMIELYFLLIITPEVFSELLISILYKGNLMVTINNTIVVKWQVYITTNILSFVFLIITYKMLKSFRYNIQPKDVAILTFVFLLLFCVSFTSIYVYLNLNKKEAFIIDFGTAVLSVYFFIQFLYSKNVSYLRNQEQQNKIKIVQLQQQFLFYQEKLKDEERIRSIYHDMKNHLLVLEQQNNSLETEEMIEKLKQEMAMYEDYVHTGNGILDIILKEKAELAREKHIEFSVTASLNGIDFIEPLDISTIFGNGLDNAIEASEKLQEEQRVIIVKAGRIQNFFSILIENNCIMESGDIKKHTSKQDNFLHGFGILNMEKASKKYDGQLVAKCENGKFSLKILIPVPQ